MTPTEQDKELRRNICGIATGVLWGKNFNELTLNERSRVNAMAKDLEAYITTDRKRVALEARLQEVEVSITELERSDDPRFYGKDEAIRSQRARYTQLEQELEKL